MQKKNRQRKDTIIVFWLLIVPNWKWQTVARSILIFAKDLQVKLTKQNSSFHFLNVQGRFSWTHFKRGIKIVPNNKGQWPILRQTGLAMDPHSLPWSFQGNTKGAELEGIHINSAKLQNVSRFFIPNQKNQKIQMEDIWNSWRNFDFTSVLVLLTPKETVLHGIKKSDGKRF